MGGEERDEQTYAIIGCAMAVHSELGHGFLEAVYHKALEREFQWNGIAYDREKKLRVRYKGRDLNACYIPDFVCYGAVIVEIKALQQIFSRDVAQVINYLRASNLRRGLLLNFGSERLDYRRVVFTPRGQDSQE